MKNNDQYGYIPQIYNMNDILLKSGQLMDKVLTTQQKQQIASSMSPSADNTLLTVILSFAKIYSDVAKATQLKNNLSTVRQLTPYGYQMQVLFIKLLFDYYDQMLSLLHGKYDDLQIIQYLQILLLAYNKSMAYNKSTAEP